MSPRLICTEGPPIMTIPFDKPLIVDKNAPIIDVAKKMVETGMSSAVIVDKNGKLEGVVTDRIIVEKVVAEGKPYDTPVKDVMIVDPLTGKSSWSLAKALEAMAAIGVRHLVIVDDQNQPIGILHLKDLVKHIIEDVDIQELPAAA